MKWIPIVLFACLLSLGVSAQPVLKRCVYFDTDSFALRDDGIRTLEKLVDTLTGFRSFEVHIKGNTDAVGDSLYNATLSEKRSQAVYDYLRSRKMCGCKLKVESFGESRPVADNNSETGKQRNRRVEIYVVIPAKKTIAGQP
jgi:OmpA-OmpF porin, OOP family